MSIHYPAVFYTIGLLILIPMVSATLAYLWVVGIDKTLKYLKVQHYVVQFMFDKENRRRAIARQKEAEATRELAEAAHDSEGGA